MSNFIVKRIKSLLILMPGPIQDIAEDDLLGTGINDTNISNYSQVEKEFFTDNISNLNVGYPLTLGNSGVNNIEITTTGPLFRRGLSINKSTSIVPGSSQSNFYISTTNNLFQSINTTGNITTYQPIVSKGQLVSFSTSQQTQSAVSAGITGYILSSNPNTDLGLEWIDLGTTVANNFILTGTSINLIDTNTQTLGASYGNVQLDINDLVSNNIPVILHDEKSIGTPGGTIVKNIPVKRDINTIVSTNPNILVSVTNNTFTLYPGTFTFDIKVPAYACGFCKSWLYDNTHNAIVIPGLSTFTGNGQAVSHIIGVLEVTANTNFEVRMQSTVTQNLEGLGRATGITTEIYTSIVIQHIKLYIND